MTTLDTLNAALQARRGLNYFSEFDAYTDALTAAIVEVGAGLVATSTTEATIGTGAQTLTVQAEKNFAAGQYAMAFETGTPANYMLGVVDSYNQETGALAFTVASGDTGGSGTISTWTVVLSGRKGATGATGPIASGTLTGNVDADSNDITDVGTFSAATGTITDLTSTTATVTDLTVSDTATIDFATVAAAGEAAEGNPTNVSGDVILQATGAPVLRHTLTGDTVYKVAGAPTPGHGWSVELRTTQDATGSRAVTIEPVNELTYSADLQSTAEAGETRPWTDTNTSLDDNAAVGPDGRTTLTKLIADAVDAQHFRQYILTGLSPNQTLSGSFEIKDAGDGLTFAAFLYDSDSLTNSLSVKFDPASGEVTSTVNAGNATGATAAVAALPNSNWLLTLTGQPNTSGSNTRLQVFAANASGVLTFLGDGTSGVYIGNIQVNAGNPVGMIKVGATRTSTYRITADEIDDASDAAATEHRRVISAGSDGEILVDVADLES